MSEFGDFGASSERPAKAVAAPPPMTDEEREAAQKKEYEKAREKGWAEPTPYEYGNQAPANGGANGDAHGESQPHDAGAVPEWLAGAAVYEWDDEFGEVGPANEELERELFHSDTPKVGHAIKSLTGFSVVQDGGPEVQPVVEFDQAGLHPVMLENVKKCGFFSPTPIQMWCIPAVLTGHDVIACAQTGSGKTAAYLIPILSKLMGKARVLAAPRPSAKSFNRQTNRVRAEPLVLIVCPTRELASQIFDDCRRLCYRTMLRPCVIYGGAPTRMQRENLEMGCDVLIATPGRLMDFMAQSKLLSFSRLKFTVIDEADELLSGGWEDALEKIFAGADVNEDADHTYMMFSATFPKSARRLAKEYMQDDVVKIKVGRVGSSHENIKQSVIWVEEYMKNQALYDLILDGGVGRTLVFVNSKRKAEMVDDFLYNKGLPTTSIHSDRTQREREDALRSFKTAKCPILVSTGLAARGLDVVAVQHVINYDLPSTSHDGIVEYTHRIGRTARMGHLGRATSFYNSDNDDIAVDLVKLLIENKQDIPDFLQDKVPEKIEWNDGTDDESEQGDAFGGADNGFGGDTNGFGGGDDIGGGFGGSGDAGGDAGGFAADDGFKADDGFQADAGFDADKVNTW